jgi:sialidase-1
MKSFIMRILHKKLYQSAYFVRTAMLFTLILFVGSWNAGAQPAHLKIDRTDNWHGFVRENFTFQGRPAWIVQPRHALAGNPWVWRAHFPDWHICIDSILLGKGFHIAYVNTNDMYGSPAAMQIWDRFYDYLVKDMEFAPKVALEGVSRGGLYVYGWAKRNPFQVSCLYAEASVCDFKSWPGGKKNSPGSEADWNLLLKCYGFSEEQAMSFSDNPADNLEGLAGCRVPVLHSIGLDDKIVPPEENTYVLINNYIRMGGLATVYPMTRGPQELEGHHFPIESPGQIADYIMEYSYPVTHSIDPSRYISVRNGLQNSFLKFAKEKKGTVAFMGGSITENPGWRVKVCKYLTEAFPETKFTFINGGISSTGSVPGAFRLETDILSKGTIDLFFEEAAVNDRVNFFNGTSQVRGMEGIIRHALKSNPFMDIIVMYFASPDNSSDYRNSTVPEVIVNHDKVAAHYNTASIDLAKEVTDRIDAHEFTWEYDFKDLHPSPFGQEVYFRTIRSLLYNELSRLDSLSTPVSHPLPPALDKFSYFNGSYVPVEEARVIRNWQYVSSWKPQDKTETRKQYVDIPALIADTKDALLKLSFTGNAVGICITSGPDAGIIEYRVDNKPFKRADLFTIWSKNLHLPWYLVLDDQLQNGKHTLQIRITAEKNPESTGHACRIMHFLVNK